MAHSFEIDRKAKEVLIILKEEAEKATSCTEWMNRMSGPNGVVAHFFPESLERQCFYDTPEYEELKLIRVDLLRRFNFPPEENL